jgi:hypothetical protein
MESRGKVRPVVKLWFFIHFKHKRKPLGLKNNVTDYKIPVDPL